MVVPNPTGAAPSPAEALLARATPRRLPLPERGVELALLDWEGDGPPLLLHHANGFCKGVWGLVAEALRGRFRVFALDARGHGESSRPTGPDAYAWAEFAEDARAVVEQLLGELGVSSLVGVGHSFGGTSLLCAAARKPALFQRLVLVDPVIPSPVARGTPERIAHLRSMVEAARRRRHEWPSRAAARAWLAERSLFAGWDPRALDLYVADGLQERADGSVELRCPGEVEAAVFGGGDAVDVFGLVGGCPTPALFLWAAQGRFPRERYEALAASMGDARVESVACGHLVPMERPDLVVEAVGRAS
ncbi:MAG: alpha/beta fold hydrolase [Myxococcota bacterium]|nr:alpha/beta fold hydrolase [Myxococcota bacterium]